MHNPFTLNRVGLAALTAAILLTGGACKPGQGNEPAKTPSSCAVGEQKLPTSAPSSAAKPPSAIGVGKTLPPETVDRIADNLGTPSLKSLHLTVLAKFTAVGNFTVLTIDDTKPAVTNQEVERTASQFKKLAGSSSFKMTLKCKGQPLELTAQANMHQTAEHVLVYVGTAEQISALHSDIVAGSNSQSAFTIDGNDGYTVSFVPMIESNDATVLGKPIPRKVNATFVELCQNLWHLDVTGTDANQASTPQWKGKSDEIRTAAQETVCNSTAAAKSLAWARVSNADYESAVQARQGKTTQISSGVEIPLLLMNQQYDALK